MTAVAKSPPGAEVVASSPTQATGQCPAVTVAAQAGGQHVQSRQHRPTSSHIPAPGGASGQGEWLLPVERSRPSTFCISQDPGHARASGSASISGSSICAGQQVADAVPPADEESAGGCARAFRPVAGGAVGVRGLPALGRGLGPGGPQAGRDGPIEVEATEARQLAARLRFTWLPEPWTLNDFDFAAQRGVDEKLIRDLATLRFLDDASTATASDPVSAASGWTRGWATVAASTGPYSPKCAGLFASSRSRPGPGGTGVSVPPRWR
ncbi:ATP-binding protein [Actinacidiphila yanglinensis]|uniref:ATP-binding protein n=1 Tax=Actinacidiphila yanglinensis TaxID=310779 RepID=UPI001F3F9E8A|nr:ATP-binding protein [Actinacidiphila yanglinensis]